MSTLHRLIQSIPPPTLLQQQHQQQQQYYHHSRRVIASSECSQLPNSSVYVMINTDEVPKKLEAMVDIFSLFDSIRYIVGYCLPLKYYVDNFGNAEACRVVRAVENVQLYQEHITRFKFHIAPLNVVPVNKTEFFQMIESPQILLESRINLSKNCFSMRPGIIRPTLDVMQNIDYSVTQYVSEKFKFSTNPHLIPIRLPDGLECYVRLNLAKHCQEDYCGSEDGFGYNYFRETQKDLNNPFPTFLRPPPILPLSLQQQFSRPPPPLPLRRTSSSVQKWPNDLDRFECMGKENKLKLKYSQSLSSAP